MYILGYNNEEEGGEEDEDNYIGLDGVGVKRRREMNKSRTKNNSKNNLKDKKIKSSNITKKLRTNNNKWSDKNDDNDNDKE